MPVYQGTNKAQSFYQNRQLPFWSQEIVTAGTASVAYHLMMLRGVSKSASTVIEVAFQGNPGAYEIDIQAAESDMDGNFVGVGQLDTTNATLVGPDALGRYVSRTTFDGPARLIRLFARTIPNAVPVTAIGSR